MSNARRIAINSGVLAGTQLAMRFLSVVAGYFFIRWLSRETFNDYSLIMAHANIFAAVGDLGCDLAFLRLFSRAEHPEEKGRVLWNALVVKTTLVGVTVAVTALSAFWIGYPPNVLAGILVFSLSNLPTVYTVFLIPFRAEMRAVRVMLGVFLLTALGLCVKLALAWNRPELLFIVGAMVAFEFVKLTWIATHFAGNESARFVRRVDGRLIREIFNDTWPLAVIAVCTAAHVSVDQILLHWLMPEDARDPVASYATAVYLVTLIGVVPGALTTTLMPLLSRHFGSDETKFAMIREKNFKGALLMSAPLAVFTAFYARQIIFALFEFKYDDSATLLAPLACAIFFQSCHTLVFYTAMAAGGARRMMWIPALSLAANVAANVVFIPRWGTQGAAYATLLTYALSFFAVIAVVDLRAHVFSVLRLALSPLIASAAPVALCFFLKVPYPFLFVLPVAYILILRVLRYFDQEDAIILKAVFKRG